MSMFNSDENGPSEAGTPAKPVEHPAGTELAWLLVLTLLGIVGGLGLGLWSSLISPSYNYLSGDIDTAEIALKAGLAWWSNFLLIVGVIALAARLVLSGTAKLLQRTYDLLARSTTE